MLCAIYDLSKSSLSSKRTRVIDYFSPVFGMNLLQVTTMSKKDLLNLFDVILIDTNIKMRNKKIIFLTKQYLSSF